MVRGHSHNDTLPTFTISGAPHRLDSAAPSPDCDVVSPISSWLAASSASQYCPMDDGMGCGGIGNAKTYMGSKKTE